MIKPRALCLVVRSVTLGFMKLIALSALTLVSIAGAQSMSAPVQLGLSAGYGSGLTGEASVRADRVAGDFGARATASYARVAANQNVNEGGTDVVLGVDALYPLAMASADMPVDLSAYAGARYGIFTRSDNSAGTTVFDSKSFGIGAGVLADYMLTEQLGLNLDLGVNHFFPADIHGRDATTSGTVSPSDADYASVRSSLDLPSTAFKARIGVTFKF